MTNIKQDLSKHCLENIVPNPYVNFMQSLQCLRGADVVITTAASSFNPLLQKAGFDYVIVDEASQVNYLVSFSNSYHLS